MDIIYLFIISILINLLNVSANRFARMESKLALFYLLKNSKLFFIKETENPIQFQFSGFTTVNKHGYWLGIKPRN